MKSAHLLVGVVAVLLCCLWCSPPSSDVTPELEASPLVLDFGESTNSLQLTIRNTGKGKLDWEITVPSEEWVNVSRSRGITTDVTSVDIQVIREGMSEGSYAMTLKVISDGGEADVQITMHVNIPPKLSVSPLILDFGQTSDVETFQLSNTGGDTLRWTATSSEPGWMSVSPAQGQTRPGDPITIRVASDRSNLGSGNFSGHVDVVSEQGGVRQVAVQITNTVPIPNIAPTVLDFGVKTKSLTVEIRNGGGGTLEWTVSASEGWIGLGTEQGGTSVGEVDKVTVTVNRAGLDPGAHTGQIRFISASREDVVTVRMSVPPPEVPELSLSPTSLSFDFTKTPPDPSSLAFGVSNAGKGLLTWSISSVSQEWVLVNPNGGTLTEGMAQEVRVVLDRQGLAPGTHGAVILVDSDGGTAEVAVSAKEPFPPKLKVMPTTLNFGTDLSSLGFNIINDGDGTLIWSISEDVAWMDLSGYSGTTGRETDGITVVVSREGLDPGTYSEHISVASDADTVGIAVTMIVLELADTEKPTVQITAPSGGTILGGAVQVQATASDNVGVTRVTLYVDGAELSTDTASPYAWTWDTSTFSNGAHTLTASVWDAEENKGTSAAV
ncbi:MAG: Ig-like domain-containing protein, partial [Candidatus Latescibacterota bacterium]